jgi:hypothetical protein
MFRTTLTVGLLFLFTPAGFAVTSTEGGTVVQPAEPWDEWVERVEAALYLWPSADMEMVPRVARAVAEHSYRANLQPDLVLAVMRVENPWLKPDTVSYAGAVGLLQVDTNVCKGVLILSHYLKTNPDLQTALLAYNGCRSTHCEVYYDHVTRHLD